MGFDVLLQVLGSFESFPAEVALMGLQRDMDTNVRRDVVALHSRRSAVSPLAREVEVVCALAAYMLFAYVVLEACQWMIL